MFEYQEEKEDITSQYALGALRTKKKTKQKFVRNVATSVTVYVFR